MSDIDECQSSPCLYGGNCVDDVNGYTCECIDGYDGVICETGFLLLMCFEYILFDVKWINTKVLFENGIYLTAA